MKKFNLVSGCLIALISTASIADTCEDTTSLQKSKMEKYGLPSAGSLMEACNFDQLFSSFGLDFDFNFNMDFGTACGFQASDIENWYDDGFSGGDDSFKVFGDNSFGATSTNTADISISDVFNDSQEFQFEFEGSSTSDGSGTSTSGSYNASDLFD